LNEYETRVEVVNEHGLHARPATQFTQLANRFEAEIEVFKGDMAVDGKSVVSMLTLGA